LGCMVQACESCDGVAYVEEVQLIRIGCTNAVCEEQEIALEPGYLIRGKLEADAGTQFFAHDEVGDGYTVCSL